MVFASMGYVHDCFIDMDTNHGIGYVWILRFHFEVYFAE